MSKFTLWSAISALLLIFAFAPAAQAQSCDEGFVFDPDDGVCVPGTTTPVDPDNGNSDDLGGGTEPRLLRFLTPDNGSSYAAGTEIAPTGRTSLTLVQNLPLDLTIVLDNSASMRASTPLFNEETPNPNDRLTRGEVTQNALDALLGVLPQDTILTTVLFGSNVSLVSEKVIDRNFDGVPDMGRGLTRAETIAHLKSAQFRDQGTFFADMLDEVTGFYNDSVVEYLPEEYDRELLILSDGQNNGRPVNGFLPFVLNSFGDTTVVSLPGNSPGGTAFLQSFTQGGARFIDTSQDAQDLVNVFSGLGQSFSGLEGLQITNPDGTTYDATTDVLGQFTLNPFALREGENVFTALATFEGGLTETATLSLFGTATTTTPVDPVDPVDPGTPAPVPLPAAAWMLLAALGGLRVLRRKTG